MLKHKSVVERYAKSVIMVYADDTVEAYNLKLSI